MSILTQIIHERVEWDTKHARFTQKVKQHRAALEYAFLLAIGLGVYFFHSQLSQIVTSLFE